MATDLDSYWPFDAGNGANVTEAQWRKMARLWAPNGVDLSYANKFEVYGDSSGRQVKVKTGRAWVDGFFGENESEKTIALSTNGSGNARIDRIVLQVDVTTNKVQIEVVEGTPAGSPSAPSLTQSETGTYQISLAQVAIANGYTTVASGDVTDERAKLFSYGSQLTGRPFVHATKSGSTNLTSGVATDIDFNTETIDNFGAHSTTVNNERITPTIPGLYLVSAYLDFNTNDYEMIEITLNKNGSTIAAQGGQEVGAHTSTSSPGLTITTIVQFNGTTDYVKSTATQISDATQAITTNSYFQALLLAPWI